MEPIRPSILIYVGFSRESWSRPILIARRMDVGQLFDSGSRTIYLCNSLTVMEIGNEVNNSGCCVRDGDKFGQSSFNGKLHIIPLSYLSSLACLCRLGFTYRHDHQLDEIEARQVNSFIPQLIRLVHIILF